MSKYPDLRQFTPKNKSKYKGNCENIIARSSWELKVFKWLDDNPNIIEWSSEEIVIPYKSPIDNKFHRYFPDVFMKVRNSNNRVKNYLVEIKPERQTREPVVKKRITKQYITEVCTWGVNEAKWKAAREYCLDRDWEFRFLTEKDLGI